MEMLAGAYRESGALLSASKHRLRVASVIIVAAGANNPDEQTGGLMKSFSMLMISHNREEKNLTTVGLYTGE